MSRQIKFLVVRRDNIGDLVCTTPVFSALRYKFPGSFIAALVNNYNAEVLNRNPHVDSIYAYTKAKHRGDVGLLKVFWRRLTLLLSLRRQRFDYVIVAGPATTSIMRMSRFIKPCKLIRFSCGAPVKPAEIAVAGKCAQLHEANDTLRLLEPLGIRDSQTAPYVYPDPTIVDSLRDRISQKKGTARGPLIGIHISARKPSQRWPTSRFVELVTALQARHDAAFILLWSPGTEADKRHPGDDKKAAKLSTLLDGLPLLALPTAELSYLIAALSLCDHVICSDGGAMHIAAALSKPLVCLFGDSDPRRWHPLGTVYRLLQSGSLDVRDIAVADVLSAYEDILSSAHSVASEPCSVSP